VILPPLLRRASRGAIDTGFSQRYFIGNWNWTLGVPAVSSGDITLNFIGMEVENTGVLSVDLLSVGFLSAEVPKKHSTFNTRYINTQVDLLLVLVCQVPEGDLGFSKGNTQQSTRQ
jgi:hypothetical protein